MKLISIIIPVFNEEKNIPLIYQALTDTFKNSLINYNYELIFIDDGSKDNSCSEIKKLSATDNHVILLEFSRNFGKELALTAGLNNCHGDAAIMIDADLQHPVELIPDFIKKWEENDIDIVIGIRQSNKKEGFIKRFGSKIYYKIINKISNTNILPNATDYRLLDRIVIDEFNKFTERGRMTRALIDWLGFKRDYVYFTANERKYGKASYSISKLIKLAINSFVSHSLLPLKLAGYLGIVITLFFGISGLLIIIGILCKNVFALSFTGPAKLAIFIAFLIGIVLICLGLVALYISNIQQETENRPLYVIRKSKKRD